MARGYEMPITSCILLVLLFFAFSCNNLPELAELPEIPITPDYVLTMDSGTVLIDEELLVKNNWTDREKAILWEVLCALAPTTDVPNLPLLGCSPILTARLDNKEVQFLFFGSLSQMIVKKNDIIDETKWFTYSPEDHQKLKDLIFPTKQ